MTSPFRHDLAAAHETIARLESELETLRSARTDETSRPQSPTPAVRTRTEGSVPQAGVSQKSTGKLVAVLAAMAAITGFTLTTTAHHSHSAHHHARRVARSTHTTSAAHRTAAARTAVKSPEEEHAAVAARLRTLSAQLATRCSTETQGASPGIVQLDVSIASSGRVLSSAAWGDDARTACISHGVERLRLPRTHHTQHVQLSIAL